MPPVEGRRLLILSLSTGGRASLGSVRTEWKLFRAALIASAFMNNPLNIVFAGTPEFAAVALRALLDSPHRVMSVYTQPEP